MPTENFRSEEAYRKSRAYTHIHGIPTHAKEVCIKGKCHKVKHGKKRISVKTNKKSGKPSSVKIMFRKRG